MSRLETRKRVLEAVIDEPQTANEIFEKTGVSRISNVLNILKNEGKVKCRVCKMATHPYMTTKE